MKIATDSIVTLYGDFMAFLLLAGLLVFAYSMRGKKDEKSSGLFSLLVVVTMVNAVSNGASYVLHHQKLGWPFALRMILPSIAEFSTLAVLFIWLIYIDYKLYESRDRTKALERFVRLPVVIILVLFIVNIPTGIMFEVSEDFTFVSKPLFIAVTVFQYIYGILPIVSYIRYIINHGQKQFFHISPIVIPTLISSLFTLVTSYSARSFGFAIAIVLLYFSYINRWRFDDETGFFNKNYINYLKILARNKKVDYRGAVFFELNNMPKDLCIQFKEELPKGGEMIRIENDQLMILSESDNNALLVALSDMISDDAEQYDNEHPEKPVELSSFFVHRKKDESAEDFLKRINGEIA